MKKEQFFHTQPTPEHCLRKQLLATLGPLTAEMKVCTFAEVDSTNEEAKRMAVQGENAMCLLAANRQTAGRGRMGRSFYSPPDTGAYFSLLYTPTEALENVVTVTGAAAVAVMRAIRRLTGLQVQIKWVNDLYHHDKKICGILTEAVTCGPQTHVVIGIGVNLRTTVFPEAISQIAGALECADLSPAELIAESVRELLPFLQAPQDRAWLEDYRLYSMVLHQPILWTANNEKRHGIVRQIDEDGALLVEEADGRVHRLYSGEISVKAQSHPAKK